MPNYNPVIGFEIHIELATASKMFCGCPADHFGKTPNTQTCPVCLGLPGALPVPNAKAIEWCIKLGLALGCQINLFSKFDRKNYFYPDLPKGYQISQFDLPFCHSGVLSLPGSGKPIRIRRVHMEEDTGKLQHVGGSTLIDFNRSGVPLVEVVTEPDFASSQESDEFLKELQTIVRALGISTADMEKGSMRLEANISVRLEDQVELPDFQVEIKNVNSFRFIKKAIDYEVGRQIELLKAGTKPQRETRGFKETTGETFSQRTKEQAHDYRYFPDPDIPPVVFTSDQIRAWRDQLPKLPAEIRQELITNYSLSSDYAKIISENKDMYTLFTQTLAIGNHTAKQIADSLINKRPLVTTDSQPQIDSSVLRETCEKILTTNPSAVASIKAGKTQVMGFLIGLVKKELGNIDAQLIHQTLSSLINS